MVFTALLNRHPLLLGHFLKFPRQVCIEGWELADFFILLIPHFSTFHVVQAFIACFDVGAVRIPRFICNLRAPLLELESFACGLSNLHGFIFGHVRFQGDHTNVLKGPV